MKIVTAVVNSVDFIKIQYYTLKKYFKGGYEFIVFNDAKEFPDFTNGGDLTIKGRIMELCAKLNIKCIDIPNEHHRYMDMSTRHVDTFNNYVLEYQKANPDKYLILDSDMFLVDYFDIDKYTSYESAIVLQRREDIHYFWPGLCYLDFTKINNIGLLDWGCKIGCDTGGMMQEWLQLQMQGKEVPDTDSIRWTNNKYQTDTIYFIKHLCSGSWKLSELPENLKGNQALVGFLMDDTRNENGKFFCEIYDNVFLHYRAGGNWRGEGMGLHTELTEKLKSALIEK
jgi:hypothetical protein